MQRTNTDNEWFISNTMLRRLSSPVSFPLPCAGFLENIPYLGSSVGRVAGRISKGKFSLDGTEYVLGCNQPPNHLHGGFTGFSKVCTCTKVQL